MINFGLNPRKQMALEEKMAKLGIKEADIVEKFVRAGGPGGQNVNKTSTCVYLKYIPLNIEVKCQRERSQALNRYVARKILANIIENKVLGKLSEEQRRIEKIRKQKKRRERRGIYKIPRQPSVDTPFAKRGIN